MSAIHQLTFYLHVAVGTCALLLFWVPVFARKGSLDHKRFGRYFAYAMYTVAGSGFVMSGLDLLLPLAMHAGGVEIEGVEAAAFASEVRRFALFLFSLSILVFTSTRQGWLAILHKKDRSPLQAPTHLALCGSLIAVGATLFVTGMLTETVLFMVFGPLEMFAGATSLRYALKSDLEPREWWIEHLNGLIGSGIGAYTAFFVFGGSRLFSSLFGAPFEDASLYLWLTPGIVGTVAIVLLSRKYRVRFDGDWAIRRARLRSGIVR